MLDFKVIEALNLLTVYISPEAKRDYESTFSNARDIDKSVEVLTSYLIQQGFVSTIRAVVRARHIRDKYKQAGRVDQAEKLYGSLKNSLVDIYGSRVIIGEKVIEANGEEIISLFEEIADKISEIEDVDNISIPQGYLEEQQKKFISFVVSMVEKRSGLLQEVGLGAVSTELNEQLNELESRNFERLEKMYIRHVADQRNGQPLPDFSVQAQEMIRENILVQMNNDTANFSETGSLSTHRNSPMIRLFEKLVSKTGSVSLRDKSLYDAEMFLIGIRRALSFYQQLTILRGVLDKIDALYNRMEIVDLRLASLQKGHEASIKKEQVAHQKDIANVLAASKDPLDKIAGESLLQETEGTEQEIHFDELLSVVFDELADRITNTREIFIAKSKVTNSTIIELSRIANFVRVNHAAAAKEAGEVDAQFTAELMSVMHEGISKIASFNSSNTNRLMGWLQSS